MLENIAKLQKALSDEILILHFKWHIFCTLYVDEETVVLLNESDPVFFSVHQSILLDDIILTISRLTDPPGTGNRENLTLERLAEGYISTFPRLRTDLEELLALVKANCEFARVNRNRRVAHTDLQTYLQQPLTLLPVINREKIEEALLSVRSFMDRVESYLGTEMCYELSFETSGARSLIGCLEDAEAYRNQDGARS